jgi:outer membrane protein OmpA-like peptidoglycan-associated protein
MKGNFLLTLALIPATFAQQRSFVACPIVRDTKTVPCFLAEYEGETYYLTIQQDIQAELYPPQLLHEVLVEGTVAPGPRICGGVPLKPVKLSVLPELNLACNTILPAEPGIEAPPTRRPAGPSTRQAPVIPGAAPPAAGPKPQEFLSGPFTERQFEITYDFDSAFLFLKDTRVVSQAATYASAAKAKTVEITAHRAASLLSNGRIVTENEAIAVRRAEGVADILRGLGTDPVSIKVRVVPDVAKPDGVTDPQNRLLTIRVAP